MGNLSRGIADRLLAVTAITNLVGTRIYNIKLPDNCASPAISLQRISGRSQHTLDAARNLRLVLIQVDIWAPLTAEGMGNAQTLHDLVIDSLDGMHGETLDGVDVLSCRSENDGDDWVSDAELYRRTIQFEIFCKE